MTLNSEGLEKALEKAEQQAARHGDNVTCSSLNIGYDEVRLILSAARSHLSALPPVDGLEVVALIEELREQSALLSDPTNELLSDAADALSQASSVIAGLKVEIADLRDEWQAEYDARLAANTARRAAEARISSLEEENKGLEAELKKQMHRATNAEYMGWAYRSMLGEKGQQVAKAWDEKGVKRVHHSWGPDATAMTGEERAQTLLEWEEALKTAVPVETVDGGAND